MNKSGAPKSATAVNSKEKTDIKFNMSSKIDRGKATVGKTDMGIPPFTQKVRNLHKLSNIASDNKRSKGTDQYE